METRNNVVFSLNSKFYPKEAVEKTLCAFGSLAQFSLGEEEGKHIIRIASSEPAAHLEELKLEFCNYCLGLVKQERALEAD
jgi:hypothetical protein